MPSVLIAVPAHGGSIKSKCATSIFRAMQAMTAAGIKSELMVIDSAEIVLARNVFGTTVLLETAKTHLLSVDQDMEFGPQTVMRMFREKTPLIGCVYPKRSETGFVAYLDGTHIQQTNGAAGIPGVGMGLCLIERTVFEALRPTVRFQKISPFTGKPLFGFFDPIPEKDAIMSEDLSFCKRWRDIGGQVIALLNEDIGHIGEKVYRRKYLDHLRSTEAPAPARQDRER
jgi:hypothetical protein